MVMSIGLTAKNSISIVGSAKPLREPGLGFREAVQTAARPHPGRRPTSRRIRALPGRRT
jgi:hypothetical protein